MSWNTPTKTIFPKWVDDAAKIGGLLAALGGGYVTMLVAYGFSPKTTDVGYAPEQPIPYSHALHVGELGIDCRYCHTSVEETAKANLPPTATCWQRWPTTSRSAADSASSPSRSSTPRLLRAGTWSGSSSRTSR